MQLSEPLKGLWVMIMKQAMIIVSRMMKIFMTVTKKEPIMYSQGKVCLATALMFFIEVLALQNECPYIIVPMQQYFERASHRNLWQQQNMLQQLWFFYQQDTIIGLNDSGQQTTTEPKTIEPKCLRERPRLVQKFQPKSEQGQPLYLLQLKYQQTAMDWQRKSEQACMTPWVHSTQKSTRTMQGQSYWTWLPLTFLMERAITNMFRNISPIDIPDSRIDTPNRYTLSQKHILASRSREYMNLILCCRVSTTTRDPTNPTTSRMPITRDAVLQEAKQVVCSDIGTKGRCFPKNLQMKPTASSSISTSIIGMNRQAAIAGIRYIVITITRHSPVAIAQLVRMYGITLQVERKGRAAPLCTSRLLRTVGLIWGRWELMMAKAAMTAMSKKQKRQHPQSVHLLSLMGPSRHCTCNCTSLSSSKFIVIFNYLFD